MFARSVFTAARTTTRTVAPKTTFRRASTEAAEPKKSNNTLLYLLGAGAVAGGSYYYYTTTTTNATAAPLPPAIPTLTGDNQWISLKLASSEQVTPHSKLLRFELPSPDHVSGLQTASCILTKYKGPTDAKPTIRPYTPISDVDERGHMDLLVKRYEGGPMSTYLHNMAPDQRLDFKGPILKYQWTPNKHDHIALIAGGTGITPMYQLARAIFRNPEDKTKVTLVFGNVNEGDILLKKEWAELENTYPQRLKVFYVLDNKPRDAGWASEGRVTKELLKTVLPEPKSENIKIFVCGPPPMYKAISGNKVSPQDQGELSGLLKELGYNKDQVFKF